MEPHRRNAGQQKGEAGHGYSMSRLEAKIQKWLEEDITNAVYQLGDGKSDTSPWLNALEGVPRCRHVQRIQSPTEHDPNAPLGNPPAQPIKSIVKAKQHPDWAKTNGLRDAFITELHRTFTNVFEGQSGPTLAYVSAKH